MKENSYAHEGKKRGRIFPDEFIPILEKSRLIQPVGLWVLEQALMQCKKWRRYIPDLKVSVNFSLIQFEDKFLAEKICSLLNKTGMPGAALIVELTESVKLQEDERIRSILKHLKMENIQISIDDFGTGYANIGHLQVIGVDEVKIDRCFVRGVEKDTYNYRLISNICEFARESSIKICCEGVETVHELSIVEGLHSDTIQGYLFDMPQDAETIEKTYFCKDTEHYKKREV